MAKDCYIEKLTSVANNDTLKKIGEMTLDIRFSDSNVGVLYIQGTSQLELYANGDKIRIGNSGNFSDHVTILASVYTTIQISGDCILRIVGKYFLKAITKGSNNFTIANNSDFLEYLTSLNSMTLRVSYPGVFDLSKLNKKEELVTLTLSNTGSCRPYGYLIDFAVCKNLKTLNISSSVFYGCAIEDFATAMLPIRESTEPLSLIINNSGATYNGNVINSCAITFSGDSYTVTM